MINLDAVQQQRKVREPFLPIHGNTFEWEGLTYTVIVKDYGGTKLAWLDRNLGASRAATSVNDSQSYGDVYQWGRLTDGHEKRSSGTTDVQSSNVIPGHSDFIRFFSSFTDWLPTTAVSLYEEVYVSPNNPCENTELGNTNNWGSYTVGYQVKHNNAIWEAINTTHTYIAPAETGNGAISWQKIQDCNQ